MKKTLLFLAIFISLSILLFSQPKREFRSVWIATVTNIDWPSSTGSNQSVIEAQKSQLLNIIESHYITGMNALIFQIRPHCDAMYKSSLEPWSQYLTGSQGTAPSDPDYDPLQFAIEEAHKRGMELHAWFNPYRALLSGGNVSSTSPTHVINTHPEWILKSSGNEYRFLNPGLPAVRAYLIQVIMDVVRRYDVDGIHFDDYFYADPTYGTYNDDAAYAQYGYGISNKTAWRNNNVNLLLKMLNDSIKTVKPYIKFGISPAGNPGVNDGIFCKPVDWLAGNYIDTFGVSHSGGPYVDYVMPQLYWTLASYYGAYFPWWADSTKLKGRDLFIGHALYRSKESGWTPAEIPNQIKFNRNNPLVKGSAHYTTKNLVTENAAGWRDSLRNNYYKYYSLPTIMSWEDNVAPGAPVDFRFEKRGDKGISELKWDAPGDEDVRFYALYRSETNIEPSDLEDAKKIAAILPNTNIAPINTKGTGGYFAVTSLDRNSNESLMSSVVQILPPEVPVLSNPTDGATNQSDTIILRWLYANNATSYKLQVSSSSDFSSGILYNNVSVGDTLYQITGMQGQSEYYYRVKALNPVGESEYSTAFSFTTGFPAVPTLWWPPHATTNMPIDSNVIWNSSLGGEEYKVQIANAPAFLEYQIVGESDWIADTSYSYSGLALNKVHYWRVKSRNQYGTTAYSGYWAFKTTSVSVEEEAQKPKEYSLAQNYPNPFNPSTVIEYKVKESGHVRLALYDILGKEIAVMVDEYKNAGTYRCELDINSLGRNIATGMYIYTMNTNNFFAAKKMLIVK